MHCPGEAWRAGTGATLKVVTVWCVKAIALCRNRGRKAALKKLSFMFGTGDKELMKVLDENRANGVVVAND